MTTPIIPTGDYVSPVQPLQASELSQSCAKPAPPKRGSGAGLSRHPLAVAARKAAKGGGGGRKPGRVAPTIDPLPSKILPQKALPQVVVPRDIPLGALATMPADALSSHPAALGDETGVTTHPWGDKSGRAAVYARPFNPRMLLLQFANGEHGRLVVSPGERSLFNIGCEVWVKPAGGKDFYVLCGVYNRYGKRCK